ncbi:MAG: hypothetical protein HY040_24555 [Planctomycetes bacterium]|nr:hypothetical protein [Planctomycetota bacterium]
MNLRGKSYANLGFQTKLAIKARLQGEAPASESTIFDGQVAQAGPARRAQNKGDVTQIVAFDWLLGRRPNDVPDPLEMVAFLMDSEFPRYQTSIDYFLMSSCGESHLKELVEIVSVRRVLSAIPGGYSANRDKFAAKVRRLTQDGKTERRMFLQAVQARIDTVHANRTVPEFTWGSLSPVRGGGEGPKILKVYLFPPPI